MEAVVDEKGLSIAFDTIKTQIYIVVRPKYSFRAAGFLGNRANAKIIVIGNT